MLKFYVEKITTSQVNSDKYVTEKSIVEVTADVPELERVLTTTMHLEIAKLHSCAVLKGEAK